MYRNLRCAYIYACGGIVLVRNWITLIRLTVYMHALYMPSSRCSTMYTSHASIVKVTVCLRSVHSD